MDKIVRQSLLFDFYGELLTKHQKEMYGEYIQDDLSMTELANIHGISRQGAHDMVKRCEKILSDYEDRLHLLSHYLKIKEMVVRIRACANEIESTDDHAKIDEKIKQITEISDEILEQY